ncbi:MAG: hypothetical protein HC875_02630, partial [Anaerolineales bacterium]|nr:hypothetical protein [Anaerolineales bacterium]
SRLTPHASRTTWLLPLIVLTIQAAFILPFYPYYFSFYNPLAGRGAGGGAVDAGGLGRGVG